MRKIITLLITFLLLFGTVGTASAALPEYGEEWQNAPANSPTVSFTDLPPTHWAYKYIAEMVNRKVIDGYPDKKFRPDNTISRAEFAKIMVTASGIQAKKVNYSSFSDIPVTNWASPFVEAVKDYMSGYRTANGQYIFNPTSPALREDITVALVKLKGYDMSRLPDHSTIEAMFKDYNGISESAKDYVAIAVENGLVSGFPDETFRPQATVTRAEATVMLWRAFQFGNDNKTIGGGEQTTTTPASPVTQPDQIANPTTPTTNPSIPSNPQQPSQAAKLSVDTLVGGMGQGDVDGPVSIAKINAVDSMVLDKEDNIFFLDQSKNKIRKFNKSNGRVETFKSVDSQFDGSFSKDGKVVYYDHNDFRAKKLTYSYANNRLYLLGFSFSNPWTDQIFELTSSAVSLSTYGLNNRQDYNYRFFRIDNNNNFIYGRGGNWTDSFIYSAAIGSESQLLASEKDATGVTFSRYDNVNDRPLDVITADNNLYVLDTGNRTLTKIQLFPRKVETVVSFDNLTFNSVTAYNGMFYVSSGSTIYELNLNGKLSTFIAGKDLTYNDGNPINKICQLSFDSNGNVIVYDDENKAIRRINL